MLPLPGSAQAVSPAPLYPHALCHLSFWGCATSCLPRQGLLPGVFLLQELPLSLLLLWPGLHHHPPLFFWADSKHPPLPGFGLPLCPLVTLHSLPGSPPVNLGSASLPQSVSSLPAPILSPSQEIQSQVTPLCPQPGPSCLPQTRRPLPLSFFCFRTRPTVGPTTRVPSGSGCSCHPPPHPSFFSGAIRHSSQRTPVPEAVSLLVSSNWSSPQPSLPCRNP